MQSAKAFVTKLVELRAAGLSCKAALVVLRSFSQGHVTHLLRANYEVSGWAKQFDDALVDGIERLTREVLADDQRAQ